jgi:hypothetical protein
MNTKRLLVPLGLAILLMALCGWGIATASADAPPLIPFRGRLTDSAGQPVNATLPITFALYAVPDGGTAAWVEAHPAVTVTDGLFTAHLGEVVPLSSEVLNENAYLGLTVGSDSEMRPRQRLGSVPYARTLTPGAEIQGSSSSALLVVSNTLGSPQAPGIGGLGNPGLQGWSAAGAPGVAGHNDTASGIGVFGTSVNHTAVAGYAGIASGQPGSGTPLALQRAGVAGASTVGPGVFAWSTLTHSLVVSGDARVTGDLLVGGSVITNADIAESYVAVGEIEAGDVVVLDPTTPLGVRRADEAYDTRVVGVISTDPAIVLPGAVDGVPLALMGRVPVNADGRGGAIAIGDLLTTSCTPGHVMRCDDRLRCVGAIVGKALEPLNEGTGVILAVVTLQ